LTKDRDKSIDNYYITKNEYKNMMNKMDMFKIRMKIFEEFDIPVE